MVDKMTEKEVEKRISIVECKSIIANQYFFPQFSQKSLSVDFYKQPTLTEDIQTLRKQINENLKSETLSSLINHFSLIYNDKKENESFENIDSLIFKTLQNKQISPPSPLFTNPEITDSPKEEKVKDDKEEINEEIYEKDDLQTLLKKIKKQSQKIKKLEEENKFLKKKSLSNLISTSSKSPFISQKLSLPETKLQKEDNKGELNVRDKNGKSALHFASVTNNKKLIESLLKMKIDPNIQDLNGNASIHLSCKHSSVNLQVLEILHNHGANLNILDNDGNSPLHLLTKRKSNLKAVMWMIEKKADPNLKNNKSFTPSMLANLFGNKTIEEILKNLK